MQMKRYGKAKCAIPQTLVAQGTRGYILTSSDSPKVDWPAVVYFEDTTVHACEEHEFELEPIEGYDDSNK